MSEFVFAPEWTDRATTVAGEGAERALSDAEVRELTSVHFQHLHRAVHQFLAYRCPAAGDAEDLTQETFIRLYRALGDGTAIENVRKWVFTVARRLLIDHLESCHRNGRMVDLPADADEWIAGNAPTPETVLMVATAEERFHAAVCALPPLQRDCFYLRGQGLKLREIGEILERNPQRIAEILDRATASLRRQVGRAIDYAPGMDLFGSLRNAEGQANPQRK